MEMLWNAAATANVVYVQRRIGQDHGGKKSIEGY